MKRLFLISDDKDFAEWIEEELADTGRFIRSLDSLDFFFPQWIAAGGADVIIIPETAIQSEETLLKIYRTVHTESPETIFLLIYHRDDDELTNQLQRDGNICVSYNDLDTGLLEELIRNNGGKNLSRPQSENHVQPKTHIAATMEIVKDKPFETLQVIPGPVLDETINDNQNTNAESTSNNVDPHPSLPKETPKVEPMSVVETTKVHTVQNEKYTQPSERKQVDNIDSTPNINREPDSDYTKPRKKRSSAEQKQKLAGIKERIIIEQNIVTVHVPVHFNSMLVSIVSLYPRAGATFITSNFARMLGENKVPVAVLEPVYEDVGSTYYDLMHGERNAPKEWKSWAEQIKQSGSVRQDKTWSSDGVTWIPSSVEPVNNWTEELNMKLLLAANRFPVTLCDISSRYNEPHCKKILGMSDEIWVVADGDPVQLSHHYRTIDKMKQEYENKTIRVIGNRWNQYIKNSEWKEAVLLPLLTHVPDLGTIVLKQLWNGKMAWDDAKLKNVLAIPFKPMARSVMAKEMYHLIKKHYGFGARIRNIINQMKSLDDEIKARK